MIMLDYPSRANGCEGIVAQWMAFEDMLKSKKVSGCTTAPEQHAYDVDSSLLLLMPLPPPPHVCCLPRTDGTKICCFCHRRFLTVCSSRMMCHGHLVNLPSHVPGTAGQRLNRLQCLTFHRHNWTALSATSR